MGVVVGVAVLGAGAAVAVGGAVGTDGGGYCGPGAAGCAVGGGSGGAVTGGAGADGGPTQTDPSPVTVREPLCEPLQHALDTEGYRPVAVLQQ